MNPNILYEDDSLLVIDKPVYMVVNRSDTTHSVVTVQDWVEGYLGVRRRDEEKVEKVEKVESVDGGEDKQYDPEVAFYERAGIVHRIDKETSGILLIAKNTESFIHLQKQFKERTVHKKYIALVHGKVAPTTGEINVPVGRLPWNRKQFGIVPGGKEAVTHYKVISNFKFQISNEILSLLELYPKTGRTHQIRVHMKYLNHPIISDFLYAGRKTALHDRKVLERVFLHASEITFLHPTTEKEMTILSPLPDELADYLATTVKKDE